MTVLKRRESVFSMNDGKNGDSGLIRLRGLLVLEEEVTERLCHLPA